MIFFILLNFNKHDKTQILTKFFKKVVTYGSELTFWKFKVVLNESSMYRFFFFTLEQVIKIWLFLAGAMNMKTTCSQMFGQVFDIMIVALSVEEWF